MRKQKTRGQPMRSQTESRSFIVVSLPFHLPMESSIFLGVIGRRDSKRTYTVGDDVGVALQAALGVAVSLLIAGKVPDDQSLVARGRQQHVGARSRSQKSDGAFSLRKIGSGWPLTSPERWRGR